MDEQSAYRPDGVWNFNNWPPNEVAILKQLCQRAEGLLELPRRRLYRHFASEADDWHSHFVGECEYGGYYRGVHISSPNFGYLPPELRKRLSPRQKRPKTGNETPEFDNLIYIRHSTCADQTGCVITYAHELRHMEQCSRFPNLMEMNGVFRRNLRVWDSNATEIDIPAERDANLTARKVAVAICGEVRVKKFVEEQIQLMGREHATDQMNRWMFFRDIQSCDLRAETLALVQKYKDQLRKIRIDVDRPGLLEH
jgi:hypothetical protein